MQVSNIFQNCHREWRKLSSRLLNLFLVLIVLTFAGRSFGADLYLTNADFEIPNNLGAGNADSGMGFVVSDWNEYEPSGYAWEWYIYAPDSSEGGAYGGSNVLAGISYDSTGYVDQTLTNSLENGMSYTLSAWTEDPDGHVPENSARFFLFAGTNLLEVVTNVPTGTAIWSQASLTYTAGLNNPFAGLPLKVRVMQGTGNGYRVFVDNISLAVSLSLNFSNADFEIPENLGAGNTDSGISYAVPGWNKYTPSGNAWEWDVYSPLSSEGRAYSGSNVLAGLAYDSTGYVDQVLTNVLENGNTYTLSGWAEDPDGHTPENGAQFLLFAGTNLLSSVTDIPLDTAIWNQASLTYSAGINNPLAGQLLKIRIMQAPGNSYRLFVDDITLSVVVQSAPVFLQQPLSLTGNIQSWATFSAVVSGSPCPSLQWYYVNNDITNSLAGDTNETLNLDNLQATNAGEYYLVAANASGTATSSVVTLSIQVAPDYGIAFITNMFPTNVDIGIDTNSSTKLTTRYVASGSTWQYPYWEPLVYQATLNHVESNAPQNSWTVGIGNGGQIYSLINPLIGETIPPQPADGVASAWMDDTWVNVIGVHQGNPSTDHDVQPGLYQMQTAGSGTPPLYQQPVLSGFHYLPELLFNAPLLSRYSDATSYGMINWQQSPEVQANGSGGAGVLTPSGVVTATRYRDVGHGALEVTTIHANFSDTEIYGSMGTPWGGVRSTSLGYVWYNLTNAATDGTFLASAPDIDFNQDIMHNYAQWYAKEWGAWSNNVETLNQKAGYTIASAGTNALSPAMAIVYGTNSNPYLFVGLGYGEPSTNRDFTVIAVGDNNFVSPHQVYYFRCYYVFDTLGDIENLIGNLNLVADATPRGYLSYAASSTPQISWNFTRTNDPTSSPTAVGNAAQAYTCTVSSTNFPLTFYTEPVTNSYPMFYIRRKADGYRAISSDPYYFDGDDTTHTHFLTTDYPAFLGWSTNQFVWEFAPQDNPTMVDISSYYDTAGIYADGSAFEGGLDGAAHALPACELTNVMFWNNLPFAIGPAGSNDMVSANGQSIALPAGTNSSLEILTATSGGAAGTFIVRYADGSSDIYPENFSDWEAGSPGDPNTLMATHCVDGNTGAAVAGYHYIHGWDLVLNSNKTIQSILLPNIPNVKILAMTLSSVPVQLQLVANEGRTPIFPFKFSVVGPQSQTVVIKASSDFSNWVPLATNILSGQPWNFVDQSPVASTTRFYRANLVFK